MGTFGSAAAARDGRRWRGWTSDKEIRNVSATPLFVIHRVFRSILNCAGSVWRVAAIGVNVGVTTCLVNSLAAAF